MSDHSSPTDPAASTGSSSTSSSLLERVKARDPDAWRDLATVISGTSYRACSGQRVAVRCACQSD